MEAGRVLGSTEVPGEPRHICAFFNGLDEQYRVLRSFMTHGLGSGDRVFHLVDPERRDDHIRRLEDAGVDVPAEIAGGRLAVQTWEEAETGGGRFDPDSWLASFEQALESGPMAGYARTCFLGQMGWAHRDEAEDENWFEFEARLNAVLSGHGDVVICAYDLATARASVVIDALRTHREVILAGLLHENPFFVSPDRFVHEIRERRARRERAVVGS